jgi:hypothetical protein
LPDLPRPAAGDRARPGRHRRARLLPELQEGARHLRQRLAEDPAMTRDRTPWAIAYTMNAGAVPARGTSEPGVLPRSGVPLPSATTRSRGPGSTTRRGRLEDRSSGVLSDSPYPPRVRDCAGGVQGSRAIARSNVVVDCRAGHPFRGPRTESFRVRRSHRVAARVQGERTRTLGRNHEPQVRGHRPRSTLPGGRGRTTRRGSSLGSSGRPGGSRR